MNEQEFLRILNEKLKMLPIDDRNDIIDSYRQQFSEMRAEGMSDATIIANLEPIDEIVNNIKKEFNVSRKKEFQARFKEQYQNAKSSSKNITPHKKTFIKLWKVICRIIMILMVVMFAFTFIATLFTMPLVIYIWGVTIHAIGFYVSLLCLELTTLIIAMRIIKSVEKMFIGGNHA